MSGQGKCRPVKIGTEDDGRGKDGRLRAEDRVSGSRGERSERSREVEPKDEASTPKYSIGRLLL